MTIKKKFTEDDNSIYIQDTDTSIWICITRSSDNLGYVIDVYPDTTREPTHCYQVWDEDVLESDPYDQQDTMIPPNRQGEINPER